MENENQVQTGFGALATLASNNQSAIAASRDFDALAKGGYLPRLELKGGNSDVVKEGKIGMGCWALVHSKDAMDDLGKSINIVPIEWRPKAMRIDPVTGDIMVVHDQNDPEFKKIQAASETKDSGCMFGLEFLVAIQDHGLATLFCGTKTTRRTAPAIKALLRSGCTLGSTLIKTEKFSWHGPTVDKYSGSFPIDIEKVTEELEKFMNPPKNQVETVDPVEGQRER